MATLFTADNTDSDEELKVNTDYAQNYDNFRKKEELNKLKTKYGVDINTVTGLGEDESNSSSSSSDEDSDGNELNDQFEKEFYRTLAYLKKKDPSIYDKGTTFFNEVKDQENGTEQNEEHKKKKKEKALFLRDYERKIITERGGQLSDSEDEFMTEKKKYPTYTEEQHLLKESFKSALNEEEDEDTELLKPKQKDDTEKQQEEEAYKEWLKGQQKDIDLKEQAELKPLRDFWNDPNLDPNEKFLRDYVLNHKFLNKESSQEDLDYNEMIHDSDENLSEDEKEIDKQEEFEVKYNFRFEEPDQEFIKRYPRTMENSLRKKDTRRAQKRAELKKRKEEEKIRKKEELKQLKALKRKEIEEKIEKLKEITGNDDIHFNDIDLEGDFDPAEHDRKMTQIFDDEYYAAPEGDIKPEFPDIDEELGVEKTWDDFDPNKDEIADGNDYEYNAPHCEDSNFNMDADYDGTQNVQSELVEVTKKKKRRRRSKFAELIAQEKPKFDPTKHPSYEEYFDQYYALDYEDMIGDIPCRFKYRKVVPNDYGLTVQEILMADDKELNKWCSLKKALQYKPEHIEMTHVKEYQRKAQNEALKRKILRSLYAPPEEPEEPDENETTNEGAKKRRRRKKKNTFTSDDVVPENINSKDAVNDNEESAKHVVSESIEEKESVNMVHEDESKSTSTNTTESKKSKKRKQKGKEQSNDIQSKKIKTDNANDNEVEKNTQNVQQNGSRETEVVSEPEKKHVKKTTQNVSTASNKSNPNKKQIMHKKNKLKTDKKFKKGKKDNATDQIASLEASRLKVYGINAKKFKNKLKYGKKKV
ncbi:hypothetical protein KPH14_007308 [Odynerus spinipes]|uniref:Protein KRI1 homolog n=1 Tax=Odynerus spinipes TaxID=1348599 RepID=A0AAD9RBF3_9HYME|nr:hypothetical protein KPH14_007308 [Odynerus spinipes]